MYGAYGYSQLRGDGNLCVVDKRNMIVWDSKSAVAGLTQDAHRREMEATLWDMTQAHLLSTRAITTLRPADVALAFKLDPNTVCGQWCQLSHAGIVINVTSHRRSKSGAMVLGRRWLRRPQLLSRTWATPPHARRSRYDGCFSACRAYSPHTMSSRAQKEKKSRKKKHEKVRAKQCLHVLSGREANAFFVQGKH